MTLSFRCSAGAAETQCIIEEVKLTIDMYFISLVTFICATVDLAYRIALLWAAFWRQITSSRCPRVGVAGWLLVIASVSLFTACSSVDDRHSSTVDVESVDHETLRAASIVRQTAVDRIYHDWFIEEIALDKTVSIGNVGQLRLFNEHLFIYDLAEMNVKRYSTNGELVAVYGSGRGQGPGEFQNIFSFWSLDDDTVWIVDSMSRTISRFGFNGSFDESFSPDFFPARIAALDHERIVVLAYMAPGLFQSLNYSGEVQKQFSPVLSASPNIHPAIHDGHLFPRLNGGFIWAPRFASYLFLFDQEAKLEQQIQLIDAHEFPYPRLGSNPMQATAAELEQPHRTRAVSEVGGELFVSVSLVAGNEVRDVLDRYDSSTGEYIDSADLPIYGSEYQVYDGIIYGRTDTTFHAFEYRTSDLGTPSEQAVDVDRADLRASSP